MVEEQTRPQMIKEGEETEERPEKLEKPRGRAKKRGQRKGVHLTRFDKAVAELVMEGYSSVSAIRDKLRIDPKQFEARLKTLLRAGFFALDEQNTDIIRFGIKGFNAFAGKPRKKTEKQSAGQEAPAVALGAPSVSSKSAQQKPEEQKGAEVDLSELLEKGAPKTRESFFIKRQKVCKEPFEEIPVAATASELWQAIAKGREKASEKTALLVEGKEVCELCKTGFKLAVSGGNPKYGHCFCGAAYHKDCYETLLDDSGKCVRCGKKLKLELDRKSEEAVRQIKDVFE